MDNTQLYNTSTNDSVTDATKGTAIMVLESCILVFLDVAAIFGNSLVCAAFYRNPSLRKVTNYFVFSLALTDLSMAVLVMPRLVPLQRWRIDGLPETLVAKYTLFVVIV